MASESKKRHVNKKMAMQFIRKNKGQILNYKVGHLLVFIYPQGQIDV